MHIWWLPRNAYHGWYSAGRGKLILCILCENSRHARRKQPAKPEQEGTASQGSVQPRRPNVIKALAEMRRFSSCWIPESATSQLAGLLQKGIDLRSHTTDTYSMISCKTATQLYKVGPPIGHFKGRCGSAVRGPLTPVVQRTQGGWCRQKGASKDYMSQGQNSL